ncbi:hypothetical protein VNO78_18242 [Psophocarpus tetragonolobus]|uniref:Uncharacterized protein n=1 Tax=Psophocarpus tetragonolobus TaxID=3891 RepID=A0AAN9SKK2_PSOTE
MSTNVKSILISFPNLSFKIRILVMPNLILLSPINTHTTDCLLCGGLVATELVLASDCWLCEGVATT